MAQQNDNSIKKINLRFDTALPVPEKARELGLSDYAEYAYRNVEVAVRVEFPSELLEQGKIVLPARLSHIQGECQIVVDADSYREVTVNPLSETAEGLVIVKYVRGAHDKVIVKIFAPPPVPVIEVRIPVPARGSGERWGNNLVAVHLTNQVYLRTLKPGVKGKGRNTGTYVPNGKAEFVNRELLNEWTLRDAEGDARPNGQYPWMRNTALHVCLCDSFQENPEGYEENCAAYQDGMHEDVTLAVKRTDLKFYSVPKCHTASTQRGFFIRYLMNYKRALDDHDSGKLSTKYEHIEPRTDAEFHFHFFTGEKDMRHGRVELTGFGFGAYPPLFTGRKNDKGENEINDRPGILVFLDIETFRAQMAAFCTFYADGGLLQFCKVHGMIVGDEAFAEEDVTERNRIRKAEADAREASKKAASDSPAEDERKSSPPPADDASACEPPPEEDEPEEDGDAQAEPDFSEMGIDPAEEDDVPADESGSAQTDNEPPTEAK